jgi:uncharacterized protein
MARRYPRGPFDPFDQGPFGGFQGEIRIPRPPRRFWFGLAFIGAALLVILLAAPTIGIITETQWFSALGFRDVYLTRIALQFWLFLGSLLVSFAFGLLNVYLALRMRTGRALRAVGIRRRTLWSGAGAVGVGTAALISLIISAGVGAHWQELALFLHATPSGTREPVFNLDVSFYLLTLPFLHDIVGWLFALFSLTIVLVVGLYGWRGDTFDLRLPPRAIAHISVLLGGFALVLAAGAILERYDLLYAHNGAVWGAGYTDVNARIGIATVRAGLAILLAILLFANAVPRRPAVIIGAVAIWVIATVISGIYPAFVQRFAVTPNEPVQEAPYIKREIQGTRQAFAVDNVASSSYNGDTPLTRKAVDDDLGTVQNLRLWDNKQLQDTYQQLQSIRTYYTFQQIDLDRYPIDGKTVQLEISARELDPDRLPPQAQNWVNQKLQYSHGYGVAASPVSAVVGEGLPDYVAKDVPPTGPLKITRPEIYFGQEQSASYVLVPSAVPEFDYPQGNGNAMTSYRGTHGVPMTGGSRLLWSMRTGDFNLLVSGQVQDRTQILFRRNVQDRINAIAPFLELRDKPYVVVVDGKIYWIQDAYVSAGTYPYSQQMDEADGKNYLRNSVKVVVDAYDGTADFYIADPTDPVIRAYRGTFPTLFKSLDQMPDGLKAHLRVPERQFLVQSLVYATYHVSDPGVLYRRDDQWVVPEGIDPYYVEMRLPPIKDSTGKVLQTSSQVEYLQIIPFTQFRRQNLIGWLAVRNDPPNYGQMVAFVLPNDRTIFGPQQILSRIQQTPEISRDRTLLNSQGSSVIDGNLLVVPVGDSFLYFQPWYLKSTTTSQSLPELKRVILTDASTSGSVAYQPTLDQALAQLVGEPVSTGTSSGTPPATNVPPQTSGAPPAVAGLVSQALQHYNAAQDALKRGDLAAYANEMNQVGALLQQIDAAQRGVTPSPGPSPSPSPR